MMDAAALEFPSDDFGDGRFAATDVGFEGECPDNLSMDMDMFLALLDEEGPAADPPAATTAQSASQVGCGSLCQGESSSDQVQTDNALKLQPGPSELLTVMELSGEPGSHELDQSASMCLVGCKQAKLLIDCDSLEMNSEFYDVPENPETHWLKLCTEENKLSIPSFSDGSFDNLVSSDFEQQLQGNLPNCNVPFNPAVKRSLIYLHNSGCHHSVNVTNSADKAPMQIIGENFPNETETFVNDDAVGSSLILDAENSNLNNEVTYIMNSTADPGSMAHEENFCLTPFGSSSTLPYEMLQDVFNSKTTTTGTDVMHNMCGSSLTSHMEPILDIPENDWTEFFPISCPQSLLNHKENVLISKKDETEEILISTRSSCGSEMDLGTDDSFFTFPPYSPSMHFEEIHEDAHSVWNHQMDMSFRSESSTDSSPLPSSRKSTYGNLDMPTQLHAYSETNLHCKRERASWECDNDEKNLTLFHNQQNRCFKGSKYSFQKYPPMYSVETNVDSDVCFLDDISCPQRPPSSLPLIKPQPALEHSGFGGSHNLGFGVMRLKPRDEMLTLRLALEDLSQPKSEVNPPDGSLAVPLLRHQRIALSWMVQKETRSLHCSGGILADDQGLGKTVSTIALILTERSPPSYSYASAAKQDKPKAVNLEEDDGDDASRLDVKRRAQVSSSSANFGSEMKDNSLTVVKSRPAAGTLVVCPTSVLRQWAEELQNKVTKKANLSFLIYHGSNRTKDPDELAKYDVVLTTYAIVSMEVPKQPLDDKDEEKMKSDPSWLAGVTSNKKRKTCKVNMKNGDMMDASLESARPLARVRWFRVILDEAQSIKNFRTQIAKACWGLRAKRRWCLSGTPIQNAVDDLYSYFRFLRYEPYSIFKTFCSNIKIPINRNPVIGYKKLQAVLKTIMLRRTKGTFIDGKPIITLPPKTVTLKKIDFSNDERSFYSTLEAESREQFQVYAAAGTVKQNYVNILLMLLRLRQACDHPLLVKGHDPSSGCGSSLEMAKRLPKEKQMDLLSSLEVCSAICTICNDSPEDAVISICGHIFCNQCICGHLTGDENMCPSTNCKVRINVASVFSKTTLVRSVSDLPSDYCVLDTKDAFVNKISRDSSKIKTALEILRSLPRYECPLEVTSVKADHGSSEKSYNVGDDSLQTFSGTNIGKCSPITNDMKVSEEQKFPTREVSEKAIVFSQWTGMLDLLETPLKDSSIKYRRLDGTMSIAARDKAVKDFNTLPEVTVMIMSLKAASLGLNMVAACHVLLLDLWWNPTTEDQAIDRAHRIGQTRPVTVSRLTVKDTVEDRILSLQEKKREMVASAFGEDESGSRQTRLTVEDLTYLFGS